LARAAAVTTAETSAPDVRDRRAGGAGSRALQPRARSLSAIVAAVWSLALLGIASTAGADARTDYLLKLLEGSNQFRVRVQAAISLAAVPDSPEVQRMLAAALRDEHPAVRAAAATTLGRLGNAGAMPALKALADDREKPVRLAVQTAVARLASASRGKGASEEPSGPRGPPRFYVAVGRPASKIQGLSAEVLSGAESFLQKQLGGVDGVMLAPGGESPAAANQVLKKRRLKGYYIESSITSIEKRPDGGVRAAVSVIVATYPGRDMRAIMNGAATVMGMGGSAEEQAVQGALTGALRKLPQALGL
jgi:hypothetical protein